MLTFTVLAQKSQQFRKFYESLHAYGGHEGPEIDTPALLALSGEERSQAEALLIERIPTGPVVEALADIKSERGAAVLKAQVEEVAGSDAVRVALALWRIEKWPPAQKMLIDVLEGRLKSYSEYDVYEIEPMCRAEAARALAYIPGPRTTQALLGALEDPDDSVRYWAQIALNVLRKSHS